MCASRVFPILVLASLLAVAVGCGKKPPGLSPPEPPTVSIVKPRVEALETVKDFTGRLVTKDPVKVIPQVSGRLLTREFEDTKEVKAGTQVLYRIDPVQYEADVDKAKADIARAKADMANWTAQIDRDKSEYLRQKQQYDSGAGSKLDLDKALANWKVSEAQAEVAKATKAAGESSLVKAEENLKYCTIYAPTTGKAGRSLVAPNNLVDAYKTELVTIYPMDELYAEWEVDEQTSHWYREQIKTGKFGTLKDAKTEIRVIIKLNDEKKFTADGNDVSRNSYVDTIDPEIARATATRTLRATFKNPEIKVVNGETIRMLSAGDSVRVRLITGTPRTVLTIPDTVVFTQQRKQYVYVVTDGKAQLREIELGISLNGRTEVNRRESPTAPTGLDENDSVIFDNLLRVRPGIDVTIKP